ncbi:MAG: NAD(P)-dependent oxidoreductase [Vicinamibacterales bacterium]
MRVAFIGLGRMGSGMVGRLLTLGFPIAVYDRVPGQREAMAACGAVACDSVAAAVRSCEVVLTMVTDDQALSAVVSDGLIDALPTGAIHVAMGTHGIPAIEALEAAHADRGQTLLAAPVFGRPDFAARGDLGIAVGGPEPARARCMPLFNVMGTRVFVAGSRAKTASAIKVANNFLLGCAIEAMGEAFAMVERHSVGRQQFYDFLSEGFLAAPAYTVYGRIIADESYGQVGVTARIGLKDAKLALAAAAAAGVTLPSAQVWHASLEKAIASGDGDKDWAVMARHSQD